MKRILAEIAYYTFLSLAIILIGGCVLAYLCGCTETVYVPSQCPPPAPVTAPIDYMQQLPNTSTPTQFVNACLATRLDMYRAYTNCQKQLDVYAIPQRLDE